MEGILPELGTRDKKRIREQSRRCQNAALKARYLIIVNLMDGQTAVQTAAALQVGRSTVYAVAKRFRQYGEAGLVDRREENGNRKLDDDYLTRLHDIVAGSAQDYAWRRPTWTRETLTKTMAKQTNVNIHVSTMSRALRKIGARLGRPKPAVGCPWPEDSIHSTQQVEISLATDHGRRLRLHFLPPYCPDHNRIERLWKDMYADVTRNHRCADMDQLMREVRLCLRKRNKKSHSQLAA